MNWKIKMNDKKLIGLVRRHSFLYDVYHPKYTESNLKVETWNKIADEMQLDVYLCKTRWNNIRDNYRKSLKKYAMRYKFGLIRKFKRYKYSDQLSFLNGRFDESPDNIVDCQIDIKDNQESCTQQSEDDEEYKSENKEDNEDPVIMKQEYSAEPSNPFQSLKLDSVSGSSDIPVQNSHVEHIASQRINSAKLMEYFISHNKSLDAVSLSPSDPVDAFLAGLAPTLKTFTPYYLNLVKSEIFAAVQKYDLKMLMAQYSFEKKLDSETIKDIRDI